MGREAGVMERFSWVSLFVRSSSTELARGAIVVNRAGKDNAAVQRFSVRKQGVRRRSRPGGRLLPPGARHSLIVDVRYARVRR